MKSSMLKSLAALGLAGLMGAATPAAATVTVSVSDGITTLSCGDGAACDANPVGGIVTFVYVIGAWAGSVATGASTSPVPLLDLHGFATSAGGGSLTMYVSDIDYTLGAAATLHSFLGAIGGTQPSPGASVSYAMYTDDANVLFATTDLIGSGVMVGTPFADAFAGSATTTDTFSMTLAVVVTHGGTSFSSFDFEGEAPEPGTLALLGAGLVGLAALRQRKPG